MGIVTNSHESAASVASVDESVRASLDQLLGSARAAVSLFDKKVGVLRVGLGAAPAARVGARPVVLVLFVRHEARDDRPVSWGVFRGQFGGSGLGFATHDGLLGLIDNVEIGRGVL